LPPKIAPIQVVIIPITQTQATASFCDKLKKDLEEVGIRVKIDDRSEKTVGWKFNEWELKGVPIRIEVGEKELESKEATIVRRDNNEKIKIKNEKLQFKIKNLLEEIQQNLFEKMKKFGEENTHTIDSYEEFKKIMASKKGLIFAFWCENPECEKKIKEETKATTRVLPLDAKEEKGKCIYCGKDAIHRWYFGQAY
jgi:prolyl-tRNA synthetase